MDDKLHTALAAQFEDHRIVFWYDDKRELLDTFEAISIDGVTKLVIGNAPFRMKHRLLRKEPNTKFLLFHDGPPPASAEDNWLYDVQLAHTVFHADQVSMWLADLGLGSKFRRLVSDHSEYFRSKERIEKLKAAVTPDDTVLDVQSRMLYLACGGARSLDAAMERLLKELVDDKSDAIRLLERTDLLIVLWTRLDSQYGYRSDNPSIEDFALELFKANTPDNVFPDAAVSADAHVFFARWKSNVHCLADFKALSSRFSEILNVDEYATRFDYTKMGGADCFESLEKVVVRGLSNDVKDRVIPLTEVKRYIDQRRQSAWFDKYVHVYGAIEHAALFFERLARSSFHIADFDHGVAQYSETWFAIDQAYRNHIYHAGQIRGSEPPVNLTREVENQYLNGYLTRLNDEWQAQINCQDTWVESRHLLQRDVFKRRLKPILDKRQKACIVISDALRFEVGEELARRIRQQNKYSADLSAAVSSLPSYTQLGMASLLPHTTLAFADKDNNPTQILADGLSTQGTANREAIIQKNSGVQAVALQAKDWLALNTGQAREVSRDNDLIYIYHNQIDAVGDKRDTEERTFDAAESAIDELIEITRKLSSANMSHIFITADHGFLFQKRQLEETDFLHDTPTGKDVLKKDRRFVIGMGLDESRGFKKFDEKALGLTGNRDVLIPKSVNRLRLQGSGSRFVHGGATLQEVVIPFIQVKKVRQNDQTKVDVQIRPPSSDAITTNQFAVKLYQKDPVTEKMLPRRLIIGLRADDGTLLSNQSELVFDEGSDDTRLRETRVQLILSSLASEYNNQTVFLVLEEPYTANTVKTYARQAYRLKTSLGRDFDF